MDNRGCPVPQCTRKRQTGRNRWRRRSEVITLSDQGDVLFAFDSAELTSAARGTLTALMSKLNNADVVSIKVVGHTDSQGTENFHSKAHPMACFAKADVSELSSD